MMKEQGVDFNPELTGTVRVFRQESTLEDTIGSYACSLEALACM
jgi:hypothetical protein